MVVYFGAHIGVSPDILEDVKHLKDSGGNLLQIMLTVQGYKLIDEDKEPLLLRLKEYTDKNGMKIVVHSSYTHNLAREWDDHSWWIKTMELEIKYAHMLGAIGLVVHFGKSLELPISQAYNNMYTSIIHLHNITQQYGSVKILLETSTGQGSEMCYKLEDLAHFYRKFSSNSNSNVKDRVKLCIDTCHIFAAGYNIRSPDDAKRYLEEFDELIGLKYVRLIHLNDSRAGLGEKLDRHENIGKGKIGVSGLKYIFDYFSKADVPIILETPGCGYVKEIRLLES